MIVNRNTRLKIIAAACALSSAILMSSVPAQAAGCYYSAGDGRGNKVTASGYAFKMKNACDRARRACKRKLQRAYKRKKMGRGAVCGPLREVRG